MGKDSATPDSVFFERGLVKSLVNVYGVES